MTLASIEQRSAAVIRTVFILTAHSVNVASLKISSAREETRKQLIFPRLNSEQQPICQLFFLARFHTDIVLGLARLSGIILVTGLLLFTALLTALCRFSLGRSRDAANTEQQDGKSERGSHGELPLDLAHDHEKSLPAPNKYIKYKVYHFAAPVCNICIGRPVYVPQGSQLIFSQPASVLIGEAQP
jgi:hypothetical protein